MNNKTSRLSALAAILLILCVLAGCTTTQKTPQIREPDENFLGDFNPIQLENCMGVTCSRSGKISPLEFEVYFVPRQNTVELQFSYGINKISVVLNYQERLQLADAITQYMEAYNAGNLPVRAPDRKNYFTRSSMSVAWGVFGLAYTADTYFRSNYEYIESGKPYFLLTSEVVDAKDDDCPSPNMNLYFTPSQLEKIISVLNQDELQSRVDELNRQAFEW